MKLAGLQTLRGVAANLVVFFHCFAIGLLPKYGFQLQFESLSFIRNFWSGVDLFFCISGFVMCYSYLNSKVSGLHFYRARVIRIVPIYWFFTTAIFVISALMGSQPDYKWFIESLLFFVDLDIRLPILAVGWTLQYEMFFYLLFALVLIFSKRKRFLFLIALLFITVIIHNKYNIILEFIFGIVAYLIYKSNFFTRFKITIFWLFFAMYVVGLLVLEDSFASSYRVFFFGIPALFIVASIASINMPKNLLQTAGNYSYSLYLIHFPLLSIFFKVSSLFLLGSMPAWFLILVGVSICNIAAFFTWKFIESPITIYLQKKFINID
jgi:peptidoglycan/LPS O-acetylase OafA/YrhL